MKILRSAPLESKPIADPMAADAKKIPEAKGRNLKLICITKDFRLMTLKQVNDTTDGSLSRLGLSFAFSQKRADCPPLVVSYSTATSL